MELAELITKAQTQELTAEEQKDFATQLNEQLNSLKETDPNKYLELLKELNGIIEKLNSDLKRI